MFTLVYLSLALFTRACLAMFTQYTFVYLHLHLFTNVFPCFLVFNCLLVFAYV